MRPYKFVAPAFGPDSIVSGRVDENELLKRSNNWERMSSRSKHFARNLSIPNAIKETMVAYCGQLTPVGGTAESKRVFNTWADSAELQLGKSLREVNSDLVAVLTWSDCLVVLSQTPYAAPGAIRARVQLIDPHQVATPPRYSDGKVHGDRRVVLGCVLDTLDIEIGYYIRKSGASGDSDEDFFFLPRFDPITGRFISLLVRRPGSTFPGQLRSFPMCAPVMNEINDLAKLCESVVQAGITKNLLAIMLKTSDPAAARQSVGNIGPDGKPIVVPWARQAVPVGRIAPGSITMLPPDADPTVVSHAGNADLVASIKMNLQLIAAGVNIPYEVLLKSFLGINFSGGKLTLDGLRRMVNLWNGAIERPWKLIYRWVLIEHYLLQGRVPTEAELTCNWIGASMPDPDPQKTANANAMNIANGIDSRSAIVARRGEDYETHLHQIRAEEELEMSILGYKFGDVSDPAIRSPEQTELPDQTEIEVMPL